MSFLGSAALLIPNTVKQLRGNGNLDTLFLRSKAAHLVLQTNYGICLAVNAKTRNASYVLLAATGMQWICASILCICRKKRDNYEELA